MVRDPGLPALSMTVRCETAEPQGPDVHVYSGVRVRGMNRWPKVRGGDGLAIVAESAHDYWGFWCLAITLSPMPSSASKNTRGEHERDAESALRERRVRVPEMPAVVRARKVD
jgi:hypothetical protein